MQESSEVARQNATTSDGAASNNVCSEGCYDLFLPMTSEGFMCRLGTSNYHGYQAKFLNYRCHSNGDKSFAETSNLFKNVGDVVIAIDGFDMRGKTFEEVIRFFFERSNFQQGVTIRALDISAALSEEKASDEPSQNVDVDSSDSTKQQDHHVPPESLADDSTQLIGTSSYDEDALVFNDEDEVILQKAIEEEICKGLEENQRREAAAVDEVTAKLQSSPTTAMEVPSSKSAKSSGSMNEYYVFLPKTKDGFMFLLNTAADHHHGYSATFFGYHRHSNGQVSDAETKRVFRNIGDVILSVDGVDMKGKAASEVFKCISQKKLSQSVHSINLRVREVTRSTEQRSASKNDEPSSTCVAEECIKGAQPSNKVMQARKRCAQPSKKYAQPRTSNESNEMVECIPAPEPELAGLGWMRKSFNRRTDSKHIDRYWYTPITQKKLRSRPEISRFLANLKNTGGDENEAYKLMKTQTPIKTATPRKGFGEKSPNKVSTKSQDSLPAELAKQAECLNQMAIVAEAIIEGSQDETAAAHVIKDTSLLEDPAAVAQANENEKILDKPLESTEDSLNKKVAAQRVTEEEQKLLAASAPAKRSMDEIITALVSAAEQQDPYDELILNHVSKLTDNVPALDDKVLLEGQQSRTHEKGERTDTGGNDESMAKDKIKQARESDIFCRESGGSGAASSLISINLEHLSSNASAGINSSIPSVVAEPLSNCTQQKIEALPVAFAYELNNKESEHDAKAAQLLWHSSYLSDGQKQGYIQHHVLQRTSKKRQADSNMFSSSAPAKKKKKKKNRNSTQSAPPATKKKRTIPEDSSSFHPINTVLVESIPAPEPELVGLGWIRKSYQRKTNQRHIDRYWFTPKTGKRLRSVPEVRRFLACLEKVNGDEDKAFMKLPNGKK